MKELFPKCIVLDDVTPDKTKNEMIEKEYIALENHWHSLFNTDFSFANLGDEEQKICDKYGFTETNVEQYKVDSLFLIKDFKKELDIDFKDMNQRALTGGYSTDYLNSKKIMIRYRIGNVYIIENNYAASDDEYCGANFSYINPMGKFPYEVFSIVGVLFANPNLEGK